MTALVLAFALAAPAPPERPVRWEYASLATPASVGKAGVAAGRFTWTAGTEDVAADDWRDLADKLKAPAKGVPVDRLLRAAVLNHLGGQGWELVAITGTTVQTHTFKRRVP